MSLFEAVKKRINIPILVFFLWVSHLINLYLWLKLDVNYLTYDAHRHFLLSLKIFNEYKNFDLNFFQHCIALTQRHPPLVMMITAPFYFLSGTGQDAGVMINSSIFLGILIFSVFQIGKQIAGEKTGLLAVFILTIYPVIFNQLKVYMLDLPLTAVVSLSIYFLIRSEYFKVLRYNLLFFVLLAAGMLIKPAFLLFLIGPIFYQFLTAKIHKNNPSFYKLEKRGGKLIIFILLSIALFLWQQYYFSNEVYLANLGNGPFIKKLACFFAQFLNPPGFLQTWPTAAPSGYIIARLHSFYWYLLGFVNWQVSFFFFLIFLIGLYFFARGKFPHKGLILVWLISSFVLIGSLIYGIGINMEVSAVRYTMPFLPAVAVITAAGIINIRIRRLRYLIIIITVIFGVIQFIFISYPLGAKFRKIEIGVKSDNKKVFFPFHLILFDPHGWVVSGSATGSHPVDSKNNIAVCKKILDVIDSSNDNKEKEITVTVIPDDTALWYLQYLVYEKGVRLDIFCDLVYWRVGKKKGSNFSDIILNSDYIIDKKGGWQGESYIINSIDELRNQFEIHKARFRLINEIKAPDESTILIYKK